MTVGARMRGELALLLLSLLSVTVTCNSMSPPGKPVVLGCISPEKETFTCWWEPGSDGGLPTTHRLLYHKDNSNEIFECHDYHSAGKNSCFFDKARTSIWVDYYLWVVASNALGNSTSDAFNTDVMDIVKPNAPENVTLVVEQSDNSQCLDVRWEPPHNTDTKSGWVTIKYELRVKEDDSSLWKDYTSGTQTNFVLYNISPGVTYMAQVRCRLDHGSWSEWSNVTYIKVPNYFQKEKPFWIIVSIVTLVSFITPVCLLVTKRKSVRQCLLPSVPSPKIRGVDVKLLKCGRSEDVANALIISQNFPPMVALEDQMEEYILVSDIDDGCLPDICSSQLRKKSLIISTGFHIDLKMPENNEEVGSVIKSNHSLSQDTLSDMEVTQKPCPGIIFANADINDQSSPDPSSETENIIQSLANSSYVDIERRDKVREVDVAQVDYSQVKEVKGDKIIIMEREDVLGYTNIQKEDENTPLDYSRVKEVHSDVTVILEKQSASAVASLGEKGSDSTDCVSEKHSVCTELSSEYVTSVYVQ